MKNLFKNKLTVTIVLLSVAFLFMIGYSVKREKLSLAENGVGVSVNSVQGLMYKANTKIKKFINFVYNFSDIQENDAELQKKNSDLEKKLADYTSLSNENQRLREMVNFRNENSEYNFVGCDIVSKSAGSYLDEFTINKGSKDGIEKQMIVITGEGLVGQIISVSNNWAVVQSLANENLAVGAIVESTRENSGIVKGFRNSENKQLLKLYYLPIDSKIKEGDNIFTSNIGGLYPKGIRIGKVTFVEEDKGKVMKTAVIEPSVNLNKLEEVFVVIRKNKIDKKY